MEFPPIAGYCFGEGHVVVLATNDTAVQESLARLLMHGLEPYGHYVCFFPVEHADRLDAALDHELPRSPTGLRPVRVLGGDVAPSRPGLIVHVLRPKIIDGAKYLTHVWPDLALFQADLEARYGVVAGHGSGRPPPLD